MYASALGLYELYLNGERLGNDFFNPGWTTYSKRIQYQVYDLTALLKQGRNALGAIVGDGWYRGFFGFQGERNLYGDKAGLITQLEINYEDGSKEWILSDPSWKSGKGPLLKSEIYHGEFYDARLEILGWAEPGFDDSKWEKVTTLNQSNEVLVPTEGEPVRITETLKPIKKFVTPRGELVFDFGQNLVGWVRFRLKGERGQSIVLHHAEVLDQEGNFYTDNLRVAKAEDVYIFKGEGVEEYEPRFTFHGFRYLRVSEYPGEIGLDDVEGRVVHSDMEKIGEFECSDPLINRLQQNIQWGLRGNFLDVPTDCPQRDERMGWTGDAQAFAPTACFNMNTGAFFTKWMKDLQLDQKADGNVPWVVPNVLEGGGGTGWSDGYGGTGWADAAVIVPWTVYQSYGDIQILENQYESMKAWVEYMIRHSGSRYIFDYGFHFGDWLSFAEYYTYNYNAPDYGYAGAHTEKDLIATAYFYYSTSLMSKIASLLRRNEDSERYAGLLPRIKEAFHREFITPNGRLVSGTQTAYVLALGFDLIPEEEREAMAKRLADDVRYFGHLTTGFLGTPLLCRVLSDNGYPDLAYQLLFNKRYPSWLYPVTMGATTIWERWDGIKPDGSFQTVGMNSFNHYAYGAVGQWLYSTVAGLNIDPSKPGYKHSIIRPCPTRRLNYARASLQTMYGLLLSSWEIKGDDIIYKFRIPPNTTATIYLEAEKINYSQKAQDLSGIKKMGDKQFVIEAGSGSWEFVAHKAVINN
jgi:alpha-L-rhamnosidase